MDELENQELPLEPEHTEEAVFPPEVPVEEPIPVQEEPQPQPQPVQEPPRRRSPYENSPYVTGTQPAAPVVKKK